MDVLLTACTTALKNNDEILLQDTRTKMLANIKPLLENDHFFQLPLDFILSIFDQVEFCKMENGFDKLLNFVGKLFIHKNQSALSLLAHIKLSNIGSFSNEQLCQLLLIFTNSEILIKVVGVIKELMSINQKGETIDKNKNTKNIFRELDNDIFNAANNQDLASIIHIVEDAKIDPSITDKENWTAMHYAAAIGSLAIVQYLCTAGGNPNIQNNQGNTPLHVACDKGHLNVVQYLVNEQHMDLNIQNKEGEKPFGIACRRNFIDIIKFLGEIDNIDYECPDNNQRTALYNAARFGHYLVVKYLIEKFPLIDKEARNKYNNTALHVAAMNNSYEVVKYLIEVQKVDPSCRGNEDKTPLMVAAVQNRLSIAKYLVETVGVDINLVDLSQKTALHHSCTYDNFEVTEYLLEHGADINLLDSNGKSALHIAAENQRLGCIDVLMKWQKEKRTLPFDNDGRTPLHLACQKGAISAIECFLTIHKIDPNIKDYQGKTPLYISCQAGQIQAVESLLKINNVNVNSMDALGSTPLHICALKNQFEIAKLLISSNANVNVQDNKGHTPLFFAAETGQIDFVKLFDESGADINKPAGSKTSLVTPLMIACKKRNEEVVLYLLSKGARIDLRSRDETPLLSAFNGGSLICFKALLEHGADPNEHTNIQGETIVHHICRSGGLEFLEELSKFNCDFGHLTEGYWKDDKFYHGYVRPIHEACKSGLFSHVKWLVCKNEEFVHMQTFHEKQPLHYACKSSSLEIIKFLISHGANVRSTDYRNRKAIDFAKENMSETIVEYLHSITKKTKPHKNIERTPTGSFDLYKNNRQQSNQKQGISQNPINPQDPPHQDTKLKRLPTRSMSSVSLPFQSSFNVYMTTPNLNISAIEDILKISPQLATIPLNTNNEYPIHIACKKQSLIFLEDLLKLKANPNVVNENGQTPLHIASKFNWIKGVEILLQSENINTKIKDKNGMIPSQLCTDPNLMKVFEMNGYM